MQSRSMAAARVADGAKCLAGKKIAGQRANRKGGSRRRIVAPSLGARPGLLTVRMHGHQLQCMVKRRPKLFRRGFFFPRCAAVGCRTGSRRSARGSSTCRTRLFFIVALTSSPTSSPTFSPRNSASSAQLSDHILCERQRSDAFPASVLHPDSEPRALFRCLHPWLRK